MDPNSNNNQNPQQDPLGAGATPPLAPEIPQPLNTASPATPGTTGTSSPASDPGGMPPLGGLPSQLPGDPQVSQSSGGSKKMMMIIIVILILAILGVGGYYFYMQYASKGSSTTPAPDAQTAQDLSALQTEVESIEVTDPSGDLMEIDSEINLLEATPAASATTKR